MMNSCLILFGIFQALYMAKCDLRVIDGHLTDVRDNCTVGDLTSCGTGRCCVRDALSGIPEDHSLRADYMIACRPLQAERHLCYVKQDSPFCPCEANLFCDTSKGLGYPFGYCSRKQ